MLGALAAGAVAAPAVARPAGGDYAYYLHQSRVFRIRLEDGEPELLVDHPHPEGARGGINDGIAWDPLTRRIFWSNMGRASARDGYIMSADLSGRDVRVAVGPGGAFTPKQMRVDVKGRRLYWSDREGMAVMRADMDGKGVEPVVVCGDPDAHMGDATRWCVGLALDPQRGHVYWSQKGDDNAGQGVIRRAPLLLRAGERAETRSDIETLFSRLPEPIDLELDPGSRRLYWTDRGDNTVSLAPMDMPEGADPARRPDRRILGRGLREAIGVALTSDRRRLVVTSLGGEVGVCPADGGEIRYLATDQGLLTGAVVIAL